MKATNSLTQKVKYHTYILAKRGKSKMESEERRPRYIPRCVGVKMALAIVSILLGLMGFMIFGCYLKNWNAGNQYNDCVIYIFNTYLKCDKMSYQMFNWNEFFSRIWSDWRDHCCRIFAFACQLQIWSTR